ncbi:MAG: hypothetical protein ACR2OL_16225, partial [Anderseniella sp.]
MNGLLHPVTRTGHQAVLFSKGFRDEKAYGLMPCIFRTKAGREGEMHIIAAVDEEKQIVHIKTDARTTDEQFNKSMSELM